MKDVIYSSHIIFNYTIHSQVFKSSMRTSHHGTVVFRSQKLIALLLWN